MGFRIDAVLSRTAELERRDGAVAARIDAVVELLRRVDEVRGRATEVREALAALPAELAVVERAEMEARDHEASARVDLAEAERRADEIARSRRAGDEARARAQRDVRRARQALLDAAARIERLLARRASLIDAERVLRAEADGLALAARDVAAGIAGTPRVSESGRAGPGGSLPEIEEWGARAHAALFVVRGGLEAERERIVSEAAALASAVLGEQVAGASVALVRRRLEQVPR